MRKFLILYKISIIMLSLVFCIPVWAAEVASDTTVPVKSNNTVPPITAQGTSTSSIKPEITKQAAPKTKTPNAKTTTSVITKSLVSMITSQLGVSEKQAMAGISAIMTLVKQNLSATDYAALIGGAPELGKAAQNGVSANNSGGWLASIGALLGYKNIGQMAQLTQIFSQLGLSPDMVAKFIKVALQYVQGSGGSNLMGIMAKALKF
ncbi:hypothetical protein TI05_01640 [Achromatium sp. WMS3]|nr:hypothetical protein TI05_01640 [Achromatium sp. WMS3]